MKYKKYNYILIFILMLLVGINNVYAATENDCYYMTADKETLVSYDKSKNKFIIEQRGKLSVDSFKSESLLNNGIYVDDWRYTEMAVEAVTKGECPEYIVYRHKNRFGIDSDGIFGFNTKSKADLFYSASIKINDMSAWVMSYKKENGTKITETEFYKQEQINMSGSSGFGDVTGTDVSGDKVNVNCNELFGNKNDPDSLRYLINEILMYPKIIAPILLILFGTLDFAKAAIASKTDEMKKAQSKFVKRIIAAVGIFFVPLLIDIIMELADLVWAGTGLSSCGL